MRRQSEAATALLFIVLTPATDELASHQKQLLCHGSDYGPGGEPWLNGSSVGDQPRNALSKFIPGLGRNGAGPATISRDELLAPFSWPHRRLARMAPIRHILAGRLGLDFDTADLAYHIADGVERVDATRIVAIGK